MRIKRFFLLVYAIVLIISLASPAVAFNGIKWQVNARATSNLIIQDDKIFFGDALGVCYAVDKNSGSVVWSHNSGGSIIGTPAILENKILFVSSDGSMTCLNIANGALIWNYSPRENRNEAINDGAASGDGLFFVVKDDARLYAINSETGRRAWTFRGSDQGLRTSPAYSDGIIFLGEYNGIFNIIEAKTGERLNGGGAGGAVNTPVINNGNVYFSSWDGSVQAVQIKAVIPLWKTGLKDPVVTSPSISDGIIAVGTGRGLVVALNESNGEMLWNFDPHSGSVSARPVIANGKVFACPEGGSVYELDSKSGRLIDKFESAGINTNPAYSDGIFYFSSGGQVIALSE